METCGFCGITDTFVSTDEWQETACAHAQDVFNRDKDAQLDACLYRESIQTRHDDPKGTRLAWFTVVRERDAEGALVH